MVGQRPRTRSPVARMEPVLPGGTFGHVGPSEAPQCSRPVRGGVGSVSWGKRLQW